MSPYKFLKINILYLGLHIEIAKISVITRAESYHSNTMSESKIHNITYPQNKHSKTYTTNVYYITNTIKHEIIRIYRK